MSYRIVVLNKYPDVIRPLLESFVKYSPQTFTDHSLLIVTDGDHDPLGDFAYKFDYNPITRSPHKEFVFARNVNFALEQLEDYDIFLINDDTALIQENTFEDLYNLSKDWPNIGILSPQIDGGVGNPLQAYRNELWPAKSSLVDCGGIIPVCFVFVLLKQEMMEDIGLLDENFTGYGRDDDDYCMRARAAGWITAITNKTIVRHGSGGSALREGENWSLSYSKRGQKDNSNEKYFRNKYPELYR